MTLLKADLHIHTTASDGKLTPAQIVALALETDLDVIAITDHDTLAGVEEARNSAAGTALRVVQGVEISTLFEGRECHLLAYGFGDTDLVRQLLSGQKDRRMRRARSIISKLNRLGFNITFDDVLGEAGRASLGRPHIARVMIKKGYAADMQEVLRRFLGEEASAYHRIDYPEAIRVIEMVHKAGGVTVLAHPGNNYNFLEIKELKDAGLDGIECYHSSHNSTHTRRYLDYCNSHGLIPTGGSDFHGNVSDYYQFGVLHIPLDPGSPLLENPAGLVNDSKNTYIETL
ncbi:MAG: PHP domain-containing protein [Bacteroidota bacterium]